jgi:hypothetical protein
MGDIQFNHEEALSMAYTALQTLRNEGYAVPPFTMLEKRSGVRRSTMYTPHPDWVRFREIVKNQLSIKHLVEAGVALEEKAEWIRRFEDLESRVKKAQAEVESYKELADRTFTRITAELHKHVVLAKETPSQSQARAEVLKQNAYMNQEVQRLKSEIAELRLMTSMPADVRPLAKKEVVMINEELSNISGSNSRLEELVVDAANGLDNFFASSHRAHVTTVVYILCGNFASGKSRWINEHSSVVPGVNLYLDGTNHTKLMRSILTKRIRRLNPDCTIVCVRLLTALDECLRRNTNANRVRTKNVLAEELIRQVGERFEEVSIDEDIDQLFLVRSG